jgi:hypothetical protein
MDDDVIVEIWNDPVWTPALAALEHEGNPKSLAKLLREGNSPPPEVTTPWGRLLDPQKGYVGVKLVVKTAKRRRDKAIATIVKERELRQKILDDSRSIGKLERPW